MHKKMAAVAIGIAAFAMSAAAQTTVTNNNDGVAGTVPVYTGTSTEGNSPISVSGGNVGIGTTNPASGLTVQTEGPDYSDGSLFLVNSTNSTFGGGATFAGIKVAAADGGNYNFLKFQNAGGTKLVVNGAGNVGIGTTGPDASVDVVGTSRFELTTPPITVSTLMNAGNINDVIRINAPYSANPASGSNAGAAWGIRFIGTNDPNGPRNTTNKGPAIFAVSEDPSAGFNRANGLSFYTNMLDAVAVERVRISNAGNVGIGTTSPGAKLEVSGSMKLTAGSGGSITFQDGSVQTVAYTGVTCGGDYAESVDVSGDRTHYEPGDVLVLDADNPGKMLKSIEAYSTSVSGIYSTKPGTVGRRQTTAKSPDEVPMAVVGIVPAKVSAENGSIKVGDLLVTSSTPGYAMKGTDRSRLVGAVVGKAMAKLDSGIGVIEVLVTLQ